MATRTNSRKRRRNRRTVAEQIASLQSQVARLRSMLQELTERTDRSAYRARRTKSIPALPTPDADGNYPAVETLRVILAQQIIRRREAAGWTQAELAERAGVRPETVSRIETGKNAPNVATVDKLDRALKEVAV